VEALALARPVWSTARVLVLVRHGRTAVNAQGRLQGRLDHPLDAVGQAQAVELAKTLIHVDRVVSSPLCRAQQTASVLSSTFELDERWTELDYGELDGLPTASVGVEVWDRWRVDSSFVPAGGESMTAMAARVAEACEDLREDASRREVVVVSHVSPIKAAMAV